MQIIGALLGLLFVLWLAAMLFGLAMSVVVTIAPVMFLVGMLAAFGVALLALAGARGRRPLTVGPDDVRAGLGKARVAPQADRPDPAWPVYFVGQWRIDLVTVAQQTWRDLGWAWRWLRDKLRYRGGPAAVIGIVAYPLLTIASGGALLGLVLVLVLCGTLLALAWLGWLLVVLVAGSVDRGVRALRKAESSCPTCFHVAKIPAFPCGNCGETHYDLRPGKLGALWRRCACGARLPTTVLRAAARLTATCPSCGGPLRPGAGVLTDLRLPVFGPVSAGKTRLVYAAMLALRDQASARGAALDFVDDHSREVFDRGAALISSGGDTVKTPAGAPSAAITLRFTRARRRVLLHLFDAPGESFSDRDENTELEFLDHAQGLVFVVDPFSVRWVRDQLTGPDDKHLVRANPARDDPEQTYHLTVRRLRDFRVDTGKRRLAVVVVKADLLDDLPAGEGLRPGRVKRWLEDAGLDNLVLAAERDFAEVRFFVVASLADRGTPRSPAHPFAWLMARSGFALLPVDDQVEESV
ncbi:TRAFAC clade GTPase domain-containing protein [Actinokineospora iranica]|uniref:Double-GTPase 2 domain-containing protein n=1 Tax=Actinokineospora iranica TaxID=1271860 RepID=A0A1G6QCS8_9PSEU|nr:hypothetical protein [Actinokineospora iranica]SDC89496.1 hypothetical protein SAMN05216174_105186 [Actinokineospora iranica]